MSLDFQQIMMMLPGAAFSLVGIAIAIAFLGRYPRPALMVLIASALRLLLVVSSSAIQMIVFQTTDASMSDRAQWLASISVVSSLLHGVSYLLLIWAAFTARGSDSEE